VPEILEMSDGFKVVGGHLRWKVFDRRWIGLKEYAFFKKSEGWTRSTLEDLLYRLMY
jgi:hypothetical protein